MRFFCLLFMFFSMLATNAQELTIGASAPQLLVTDQDGESFDLGESLSSGTTVVFFYPMASTPGCTKQACSLSEGYLELQSMGVEVIGVSGDSAAKQRKFQDKYSLPFTLIADTNLRVNEAFGKKRYKRQAYIFNDGKLVWRDLSAATGNQFTDIITALAGLDLVPLSN